MTHADTGKNDACPCGSGRTYGECCLGRQEAPTTSPVIADAIAGLRQALAGREFSSEQDLQAYVRSLSDQRNQRPLNDFCGLSAHQMHRFLHFPFDSPQLVTFPPCLAVTPRAPLLTLFRLLAEALGEQGLKATAKGNLPRKFVQEAALAFERQGRHERYAPVAIRTEEDFYELHVTRLVAGLSGLVHKTKGRFLLSPAGRTVLTDEGLAGLYPRLSLTYVRDFNWSYWDRYPELPFIQQSFLFTLYLLRCYGDQWRPSTFYEDAFLKAFPKLLQEVEPLPYSSPEQTVRRCYSWRCLERFAGFLSLIEVERESNRLLDRSFRLRSTPLLKAAVEFRAGL